MRFCFAYCTEYAMLIVTHISADEIQSSLCWHFHLIVGLDAFVVANEYLLL